MTPTADPVALATKGQETLADAIKQACADAFGVPRAVAFNAVRTSTRQTAGLARLAALYLLDAHLRYASPAELAEILGVHGDTPSKMRSRTRAMLASNSNDLFKTGLARAMRELAMEEAA